VGASGGIILAANSNVMSISNPSPTNHTITTSVHDQRSNKNLDVYRGVWAIRAVGEDVSERTKTPQVGSLAALVNNGRLQPDLSR
jgi:hypothetical protein